MEGRKQKLTKESRVYGCHVQIQPCFSHLRSASSHKHIKMLTEAQPSLLLHPKWRADQFLSNQSYSSTDKFAIESTHQSALLSSHRKLPLCLQFGQIGRQLQQENDRLRLFMQQYSRIETRTFTDAARRTPSLNRKIANQAALVQQLGISTCIR